MTPAADPAPGQRIVAVTGGGGGIGAAIAEALGRQGAFVVTLDPLVSLDGAEPLPGPAETTADRIVAAGGAARASSASVTDAGDLRDLFGQLGRLDAVVNVAGISRPTGFATGTEDDWEAVLSVHLGGYLNVLAAALPMMAAAGHGRILGVTSGSGWRPADAGAYSCAKRAVAALTWQLGPQAPPGVVVNAISPIAVTRMVTAALGRVPPSRAGGSAGSTATGGLSLGSMPAPEELGPLGAHLVSDRFSACRGQVLFAGGSELAVVDEPRLLEAVRSDGAGSLAAVLDAVGPGAFAPAEAAQRSGGGTNPRFGPFPESPPADTRSLAAVRSCAVVAADPAVAGAVTAVLEARGVTCRLITPADTEPTVDGAIEALRSTAAWQGPPDAVVVALGGAAPATGDPGWERVLAEHVGIVDDVHADARWARAVADVAVDADRPVRLVTLTDATTTGGRSRAQASAQLARAGRGATGDRVSAFAVSVEAPVPREGQAIGELVGHLLCSAEASALAGAELVVGPGWLGLRSHPCPGGSVILGGSDVPPWLDGVLRGIVGS